MFIIEFNDSGILFKKILDILKDRITEGTLVVKSNGIFFQSMDSAHVALTDLVIYPDAASSFDCDGSHSLGVHIDALSKIFRCSGSRGNCRISFDEDEPDKLSIEFNAGGNVASFELKLLDSEYEEMVIPDASIPVCRQTLSGTEFQSSLKDLANFAEDVCIERTGEELMFNATGSMTKASFRMEIPGPEYEEAATGTYSLPYLLWFAKAASLSAESVMLAFGGGLPLLLQFSEEDQYTLRFFLSPKIRDDE